MGTRHPQVVCYVTTLAGEEHTLEVGVQVPTLVLQQRVATLIHGAGRSQEGGPQQVRRRAWGRVKLLHGTEALAPETLVGSWCGSSSWVHLTAVFEPCRGRDCAVVAREPRQGLELGIHPE